MRVLLDTHALLWWFTDDARLSPTARDVIADETNEVYASAASGWEVATKQRLGKLNDLPQAADRFAELVSADGFLPLPITTLHALRAGGYDVADRDPFDRMLAAQSEIERLSLVTLDPAFKRFKVEVVW